jgi:hypothetical protein
MPAFKQYGHADQRVDILWISVGRLCEQLDGAVRLAGRLVLVAELEQELGAASGELEGREPGPFGLVGAPPRAR